MKIYFNKNISCFRPYSYLAQHLYCICQYIVSALYQPLRQAVRLHPMLPVFDSLRASALTPPHTPCLNYGTFSLQLLQNTYIHGVYQAYNIYHFLLTWTNVLDTCSSVHTAVELGKFPSVRRYRVGKIFSAPLYDHQTRLRSVM